MNSDMLHSFHIPVMGTGHSIDTAIRVAPFGISSVLSLVDDLLLERIRKYYCEKFEMPYEKIPRNAEDGRAKRTTAYLNMVGEIVKRRFEDIKSQPFFANNEKSKYFELLPDTSILKQSYRKLLSMDACSERDSLEAELTDKMQAGSIDVNIMVKLDKINYDKNSQPMSDEFSDAKAALRGFGNSTLRSSIVFSAGINQTLFSYMTQFRDFYRDELGELKKKIILKVSDFRSALIQGKFLAKKGLEVHEFRVESGLNCGGHAFPSNGHLLPTLLQEFKEKRQQLASQFWPIIEKFYKEKGWPLPESAKNETPILTVQGGIGNHGENERMLKGFGFERTGWATPFLLVPEATCIDEPTRNLLRTAGEDDVYLSESSPLNIPFNNIHNSGSEKWTQENISKGSPGSACPKGFLVSNNEFTELPICHASKEFQKQKLAEVEKLDVSEEKRERYREKVLAKQCICDHLGNGALIALGIQKVQASPQSICPGPNIAWFNRIYTLHEMVNHIYGRSQSLVPPERPHMFAKELVMYVDHFEKTIRDADLNSVREVKTLKEFKVNLDKGIGFCLEIAKGDPFGDENLSSIEPCVNNQKNRLEKLYAGFVAKLPQVATVSN